MGSDDPTDGMGHCVFADEVDRAYFGMFSFFPLSSWPFKELTLISFILQVSSPMPRTAQLVTDAHQGTASISSIFYLPPDQETLALIDQYFSNTGLLFPYLHEETFRETYAQLKHDNAATRRTWLGVLNMVLAMATHTTVLQMGQAERQRQSEAFYRRANGLCAEHVMNGASVEIGKFCPEISCRPTFHHRRCEAGA